MGTRLSEGKLLDAYLSVNDDNRLCSLVDGVDILWSYRRDSDGKSYICAPMIAHYIVVESPNAKPIPFARRRTMHQTCRRLTIQDDQEALRRRKKARKHQAVEKLRSAPWDT